MKTSWKPLGRSLLLIAQWRNGLLNLGGWRESTEDDEQVWAPQRGYHRWKRWDCAQSGHVWQEARDITSEVGISFGAVQSILTDILGMSKVSARWVPRMLTEDQKRSRLDISRISLVSLWGWPWGIYGPSCDPGWDLGPSLWSGI